MAILQDMTQGDIMAQLEALRAENARLRAKADKPRAMSMKVTEKGAASLYGLGRFPVTLYASQWAKVIANIEDIKGFLEANKAKLSVKSEG